MRKFLKITAVLALFIIGCSPESTTDPQNVVAVDLSTSVFQESNVGMYKGVFTTMNSEQRGIIEINIPDANTPTFGLNDSYPFAVLTLTNGEQIIARSSTLVTQGTSIKNLLFSSSKFKFNFSVESNGKSPETSNVTLQGIESDILIAKHTNRAPVIPIPGTYTCTDCGTHPTLNNTIDQTFSILTSTDPDGNSSITTQSLLGTTAFSGIGIQENCSPSGIRTTCDIESGNGVSNAGIIIGSSIVVWSGTHTFDNSAMGGTDDCSGVSGTWTWASTNFGTLTGTFVSDTMCPPPPAGPLVFEDFEDAMVTYTVVNNTTGASASENISDVGSLDYFGRLGNTVLPGIDTNYTLSNFQGNSYFGAADMDGIPTPFSNVSLNWTSLDVSSINSVEISAFYASNTDDGSSPNDWDSTDRLLIEVSLDGGGFTQVFGIESTQPGGDTTNTPIAVDSDLDGVGDGTTVNDAFARLAVTVNTAAASSLSVRLRLVSLNSGEEDIAIDNFTIEEN